MAFLAILLTVLTFVATVSACGDHPPANFHKRGTKTLTKRQATGTYPTGPAYDVPSLAAITPTPAAYEQDTLPIIATYTPGSQPPLSGAPPLPACTLSRREPNSPISDLPPETIVPTFWPNLTVVPPTDSPEVQEWLKELEGHNIPNLSPNPNVDCGNATNAAALADAGSSGRCWWTCGGCIRETDITQCKDQWEWGHTYDDGPGFYTNKLLTYLNSLPSNGDAANAPGVQPGVKATFFVVGARVISRPEVVVYEYMNNHEISDHTWSHTALTTLTNEQIVAELGWTRKAIKDVIGVTPLTFRPPFGDIDDRVRAVALAMGMRPVIWTESTIGGGDPVQWNSQDWHIHAGDVQSVTNQASFEAILDNSTQFFDPSSPSFSSAHQGVIVLQHDIYVETVNLAIGYTVPYAQRHNPQWKLTTVTECQPRSDANGKLSLRDAYAETNTDFGNPAWLALQSGYSTGSLQTSVMTSGGVTRTVTTRASTAVPTTTRNAAVNVKGMGAAVTFGVLSVISGLML